MCMKIDLDFSHYADYLALFNSVIFFLLTYLHMRLMYSS